ncbi:MAG: hypothetical protein NVSMB9_15480 [Isosphaeraceae bacterium]
MSPMGHRLMVCSSLTLISCALLMHAKSSGGEPNTSARQPLPDERLGLRTAPILLLSRPDVREDLGLGTTLAEDAERALADLYIRARALKGQKGDRAVAARKAVDDAQRAWIDAHLSPEQRTRLSQIDLQWEGPSALVSRAVISDTLELSPAQSASLREAIKVRDLKRSRGGDPVSEEQVLARQALAQLTPAQKARWHAMLGPPFRPRLASHQTRASLEDDRKTTR